MFRGGFGNILSLNEEDSTGFQTLARLRTFAFFRASCLFVGRQHTTRAFTLTGEDYATKFSCVLDCVKNIKEGESSLIGRNSLADAVIDAITFGTFYCA
jgi:hypothetical protein